MRVSSLLLLSPVLASAFTAQRTNVHQRSALHMSTEVGGDINLVVNGNNIDLTPALSEYVEKRIGGPLSKLGGGGVVRECDVHLSVYKNPKVSFLGIQTILLSSHVVVISGHSVYHRHSLGTEEIFMLQVGGCS